MTTVLKLGGSVVTEKARPETVDDDALARAAAALTDSEDLVVVLEQLLQQVPHKRRVVHDQYRSCHISQSVNRCINASPLLSRLIRGSEEAYRSVFPFANSVARQRAIWCAIGCKPDEITPRSGA